MDAAGDNNYYIETGMKKPVQLNCDIKRNGWQIELPPVLITLPCFKTNLLTLDDLTEKILTYYFSDQPQGG
jgi:hypothetical protein